MDIKDIRRNNLARLIERETKNNVAEFGRKYDLDPVFLRHLLHVREDGTTFRNMGERTARKIEQHLGIPPLSMDSDDSKAQPTRDRSFMRQIELEISRRNVPTHMKDTIIYLLRSAPEANQPE